ncbi:hypothetical protein [Massilia sp. Leaf139]|uniref:hypothetical protein n=1 Tax=Massilia sp. Leaf139 TaxID=1736272 RepID=UPI0006F63EEF|nr:hypothetical protein [Massilia sp. Leaf139]KQQ97595.1 hypothetical protein ASF77_00960 [Massilia sp. Leaf139]
MSCDRVGNSLLAKFSTQGANDVCLHIPATIVFWLLKHMPVNQDPTLQPPSSPPPQITQYDWQNPANPRALTLNCRELPGKLRMQFNLERGSLVLVLDRSNVELMRQIMAMYTAELIDLDA